MQNRLLISTKLLPVKLLIFSVLICAAFIVKEQETSDFNEAIVKAEGHELDLMMTVWADHFKT